jgi:hypothetical protein
VDDCLSDEVAGTTASEPEAPRFLEAEPVTMEARTESEDERRRSR